MPSDFRTYRIITSRILLGFYLLGVFQSPVLKMLHIVSHIVIDHEHGGIHAYADHAGNSHHMVLSIVSDGDEENDGHQLILKKSSNKAEFLNTHILSIYLTTDKASLITSFAEEYLGTSPDIPSPPPKLIS